MNNKISPRHILILILVFLVVFIVVKQLLPYPHTKDLIIDVNSVIRSFGLDTHGIEYQTQIPQNGRIINEASARYLSKNVGEISQYVIQFESCKQAAEKYSIIPDYEISNAWVDLPEVQSKSLIATRSKLSCYQSQSDLSPFTTCSYKALYEVYIVQIDELWVGYSQIDNIELLINEFDRKMLFLRKGCTQ